LTGLTGFIRILFNYFRFPEETENTQSAFSGTNKCFVKLYYTLGTKFTTKVKNCCKLELFAEGDWGSRLSSGKPGKKIQEIL
jgi:hypothetical protein